MRVHQVVWMIILCGMFLMPRVFPLLLGDGGIPLGYDPGLYKLMWQAYIQLWTQRNFSLLPAWIQHMYEPLLGMRWALVAVVMSWSWALAVSTVFPDWMLTRWRVGVNVFLPLCLYVVGRKISQPVAIFALVFGVLSCTQWEVFWWAYRKQLLWICLLLVTLRLWMDHRRWVSVPVVSAVLLVNRPAGVVLVLIGGIRALVQMMFGNVKYISPWSVKRWTIRMRTIGVLVSGILVALPVGRVFVHDQIVALRWAFWDSFADLPQRNDVYQQWWSFLTTIEYIRAGRWTIAGGIVAMGMRIYGFRKWKWTSTSTSTSTYASLQHERWMIVIGTLLLALRVFGQGFFFQRMIGYLDVFLMLMLAYLCGEIRASTHLKIFQKNILWVILGSVIVVTTVFFGRMLRLGSVEAPRREAWITAPELRFIETLSARTPRNALVIVPSRWYSPWVWGWSQRDVIAPALFDYNTRTQDEWAQIWLDSEGDQICAAIVEKYSFYQRPLYVVTWPREPVLMLSGTCFTEVVYDEKSRMRLWEVKL